MLLRRAAGLLPGFWAEIDAERGAARPFGRHEIGVLVAAAVGLTAMHYGAKHDLFLRAFARPFGLDVPAWHPLLSYLQWVLSCAFGLIALPAVWIVASGGSFGQHHLAWAGLRRHLRVYLALFGLVLIPLVLASFTRSYQRIYPLYDSAGRSWFDLLGWELMYGVQFLALEFFFRGFLLEGLRAALGHGAIFVMIVPYCMLHFQTKAVSESLGSIAAGVVLGTLAMRYRSIWGGVLLHWAVAIAMDLASLLHRPTFPPGRFWP